MTENTGNIGFEETLWKAADKLRQGAIILYRREPFQARL